MRKLPKLTSNLSLLGLSSEDLEEFARQEGEKAFRGRQIHEWIYQRGAKSLDSIISLRSPGLMFRSFKPSSSFRRSASS